MRYKCHSVNRRGSVSAMVAVALVSLTVLFALSYMAIRLSPDARQPGGAANTVRVYCASGVAGPLELALAEFRAQHGIDARIERTGGSGALYGQIQAEAQAGVDRGADLFVSADAGLIQRGQTEGIISDRIDLAFQRPVIATYAKSNLAVTNLAELVGKADVRFGIASRALRLDA